MFTRIGFALTFFVLTVILFAIMAPSRQPPAAIAGSAPQSIVLGGTYTDADAAYLRDNLQFLSDQLPVWSQYVQEAGPFTLAIDLDQGARGRAAIAKCCEADDRGVITFGHHLGMLADSNDPADQAPEARRIRFLVTLVHEVTHVRDQRLGKFLAKTNFKSCVDAERSGFEGQINFENDLLNVTTGFMAAWLSHQIKTETAALRSRELWQQYCGAFES